MTATTITPHQPESPNTSPSWAGCPTTSPRWLRLDLVAGLTAAAVIIPQAMAYASIAGLPVEVGLYTALTPMLVYALMGTSRTLSYSVTSTIGMLTASALATVAAGGSREELIVASATLAVLVGAMLVLASVLRLGVIANFISAPVLTGFKAGIGVVVFVGQLQQSPGYLRAQGTDLRDHPGLAAGAGGPALADLDPWGWLRWPS